MTGRFKLTSQPAAPFVLCSNLPFETLTNPREFWSSAVLFANYDYVLRWSKGRAITRSESECAIVIGYLWLFFELVEAVGGL